MEIVSLFLLAFQMKVTATSHGKNFTENIVYEIQKCITRRNVQSLYTNKSFCLLANQSWYYFVFR